MTIINTLFSKKTQSLNLILVVMLFSFFMLFIRISITKTLYYTFLVWNVFLAIIPYIITVYISDKKRLNKISFLLLFSVWLAFLPNAPYIITDLFHLRLSGFSTIWIDTLVISTFASTGMLLFYFSIFKMKNLLLPFFNKKITESIIISIIFLSAFGVYIGRFLRYNSWQILSNPFQLFKAILNLIIHPIVNQNVWLFTISFGLFLMLGYYVFNRLKIRN